MPEKFPPRWFVAAVWVGLALFFALGMYAVGLGLKLLLG